MTTPESVEVFSPDHAWRPLPKAWAGHRSVATVFDRYGHRFPGGADPVMDSLDAAVSLPPR